MHTAYALTGAAAAGSEAGWVVHHTHGFGLVQPCMDGAKSVAGVVT
jgi:hypothetical protein